MTSPKRPLKVFLCHAHADRDAVKALYTRLIQDGVDAWLDKENLVAGQDWEYEIRKAVRESDVVIVCHSRQFNQKGFRQKEVKIALEEADLLPKGEIFLIPARLEDCNVLDDLKRWHWVDLFEENGYENLMRALRLRADNIGVILQAKRNWLPKITVHRSKQRKTIENKKPNESPKTAGESKKENLGDMPTLSDDIPTNDDKYPENWNTQWQPSFESTESDEIVKANIVEEIEPVKKAKSEKTEHQVARNAILTGTTSNFFVALKSNLPNAKPILRVVGIIGIIIVLFWVGLWVISKFNLPMSTQTPIPTKISTPTAYTGSLPTQINDARYTTMVLVPEGEFMMGWDTIDPNMAPIHSVKLSAYYIDKYEVTNTQYKLCVDKGLCDEPVRKWTYSEQLFAIHPVVYVNWSMAQNYCEKWRGARLPTEAEWEKAARGPDKRIFPWGDTVIDQTYANYNNNEKNTTGVSYYENGKSLYGIYNMAGNVWEWVADWYSDVYYLTYSKNQWPPDPKGPNSGQDRVIRGGSWSSISYELYTFYRDKQAPTSSSYDVGFRCAKDADP